MTASGHFRGRHWAFSRGRRHSTLIWPHRDAATSSTPCSDHTSHRALQPSILDNELRNRPTRGGCLSSGHDYPPYCGPVVAPGTVRETVDPQRDAPDGPMTGNPGGPMNLAENPLPRSHAHGRRHAAPQCRFMTTNWLFALGRGALAGQRCCRARLQEVGHCLFEPG